ncbi:hypothetical protein J4E93_006384 [Alternaria ventricosa]|uniref:uncharacterized protein n=1 Tax=Alternaria ventricosa TaxID=1187951 RepID=UPI0020C44598|nr:uncharacterized protein J4E93_006384 [Alternaria ventricosa]KAI4644481.1 hypothetical protein J4E93_006384 [Alternaria ventricosa]
MSSSGYDLGPAVNGGQGDGTSDLGDTTATVMSRLDVALKDMPGVTTLDKVNALMSKVAAAKELLGGLEPDLLLQARSKVDEPDRELYKSPALLKAYEQISKNTQADAPEDEFEVAMMAAFTACEESETSQEGTHPQEPTLQDTHRILQQPQAQVVPRPKYTPSYRTWCERENAANAENKTRKAHKPCDRKNCPFFHEDQNKYFNSPSYTADRNAEDVDNWEELPRFAGRKGANVREEKAGKNDRNFDAFFKRIRGKGKATEKKADEERAQKKKKSALEVKAAPKTAHKSTKAATDAEATVKAPPKKRKVAATTGGAKGTAEQPAKRSKGGEADR